MHLKRLNCHKSHKEEKKTGGSEESVYMTMVFSNKMMKGLIVLSVFVLIVRQQALLNTMSGASEHTWVSTWHNAAHLQRDMQNKQLYFYIAVFFRFNNHRH